MTRPVGVTQAEVDARMDRLEAAGWRFKEEWSTVVEYPWGPDAPFRREFVRSRLYDPDGELVVDIPLHLRNNGFMQLLDEHGVPA